MWDAHFYTTPNVSGKFLITGGYVASLDDSLGDFPNGAVLVEDNIIKAVGRAEDISAPDAEIIDASEGVVIPGMMDTHQHVSMSLTWGIGVDQHLWHFLSNTYLRWLPSTSVEDLKGLKESGIRAFFGFMHPGHVYIHNTNLTDHEMGLIAKSGGKIALSADADVQMGMGYPPSDLLSSTVYDRPSIRLQLQVQRGLDHNAEHKARRPALKMDFTARDGLIWATRNGAKAVGMEDKIGTLTPGKRADIVILTSKRCLSGSANPFGTAVMHSTPADVDFVMVDGKVMKRDGHFVNVDVPAIRKKAREGLQRILENLKTARPELTQAGIENFFRMGEKSHRANVAEAYVHGAEVGDYLRG
ncbi:hypothetical protein CDV36_002272 [Fusarium kuroshium]|uniref:Amidohydrolase-related domain-containing protein n=1 Tax=Fusarium kuroshium TaxID=2010991 RepID=A0A3M2SKE3_9HYPO|nr:hypothetical protein CDV36_002272 [Fusarium kuroshium]